MNWYIDVIKNKYAKFDGRAGRPEYWFFILFNIIALVALAGLAQIPRVGVVFGVLYLVYALGVLVPGIAVTLRRLHDTDRSGWWVLIGFIPIVGIVLLVFVLLPGTQGNNRFGPPAPTSPGK